MSKEFTELVKVSVIIIAYNVDKYIEKCINSVINQTLNELEVIIVNDGSTDSTLDKINNAKINDNRFIVINQSNAGVMEARKSGLNIAKGEYILFIDGDDWIEKEYIEKLYLQTQNEKYDILLFNAFSVENNIKKVMQTFNSTITDKIKSQPLKYLLLGEVLPTIWSKFIRRDFINSNIKLPSNISYAEDLATVASLFMENPKIGFLNESLYNYYYRDSSISRKMSDKVLDIDKAIDFIEKRLNEKELYNRYKLEYEKMVCRQLLISRILRERKLYPQRKKVYDQYKKRKINIVNNKYIYDELNYGNFNIRTRVQLYNINYNLGTAYDLLRGFIKV